jgi:hypothetical protein
MNQWFLLHSRHTLNHSGRLPLVTFLWGNRIDAATIHLILRPLVKIESRKDIKGIVDSLVSGKYDKQWWYFLTGYQINLKLNDEVQDTVNDYTPQKEAMIASVRRRLASANMASGGISRILATSSGGSLSQEACISQGRLLLERTSEHSEGYCWEASGRAWT